MKGDEHLPLRLFEALATSAFRTGRCPGPYPQKTACRRGRGTAEGPRARNDGNACPTSIICAARIDLREERLAETLVDGRAVQADVSGGLGHRSVEGGDLHVRLRHAGLWSRVVEIETHLPLESEVRRALEAREARRSSRWEPTPALDVTNAATRWCGGGASA